MLKTLVSDYRHLKPLKLMKMLSSCNIGAWNLLPGHSITVSSRLFWKELFHSVIAWSKKVLYINREIMWKAFRHLRRCPDILKRCFTAKIGTDKEHKYHSCRFYTRPCPILRRANALRYADGYIPEALKKKLTEDEEDSPHKSKDWLTEEVFFTWTTISLWLLCSWKFVFLNSYSG